jgi:predicted nucleic acid-binding protein
VRLAYLDSSAFLKLVLVERESRALTEWLAAWPRRVSSRLLRLEARRTVHRYRPDLEGELRTTLSGVGLIAVGDEVLETAAVLGPTALRSLDAIHLATALSLADTLGTLVTYDRRMIEAAEQLGLPVASPA